jgi:copper chaperone CopZ
MQIVKINTTDYDLAYCADKITRFVEDVYGSADKIINVQLHKEEYTDRVAIREWLVYVRA